MDRPRERILELVLRVDKFDAVLEIDLVESTLFKCPIVSGCK